jgi:hypothetical protein
VSTSSEGESISTRRIVSWIKDLPLRRQVIAVLVAILAISGFFGGLDRVDKPDLPTVAEKEKYEGEPWNITVNGAGVLTNAEAFRLQPAKPGNRFLVVDAIVEVNSEESRSFELEPPIQLRNVAGLSKPRPVAIVLVRDAPTPLTYLHPLMPEELYFFWEQSGDVPAPKELEIEILGMTHRQDSFNGHWGWHDAEPKALARRPLKNLDQAK